MKDLKFTACQLMFEGLVTYSKVKRINRGYVTHYTIKLGLGSDRCRWAHPSSLSAVYFSPIFRVFLCRSKTGQE